MPESFDDFAARELPSLRAHIVVLTWSASSCGPLLIDRDQLVAAVYTERPTTSALRAAVGRLERQARPLR